MSGLSLCSLWATAGPEYTVWNLESIIYYARTNGCACYTMTQLNTKVISYTMYTTVHTVGGERGRKVRKRERKEEDGEREARRQGKMEGGSEGSRE